MRVKLSESQVYRSAQRPGTNFTSERKTTTQQGEDSFKSP